jgi:hypothetical protein
LLLIRKKARDQPEVIDRARILCERSGDGYLERTEAGDAQEWLDKRRLNRA